MSLSRRHFVADASILGLLAALARTRRRAGAAPQPLPTIRLTIPMISGMDSSTP